MPDDETLITLIYEYFVAHKKVNPKYVSREECKTALARGRRWYGTKNGHKYLTKSFNKRDKNHRIHTGTFAHLNAITQKKISAEEEAYRIAVAKAAAQEKADLLQKIADTQAALNNHKNQLDTLNESVAELNHNIVGINDQRAQDVAHIAALNREINALGLQLNQTTQNNNELVRQIVALQMRSQEVQAQLIERLARVENMLERQREINNMITATNRGIIDLTRLLQTM